MRPELEAILQALLDTPEDSVTLDVIGQVVGAIQISQAEIEELFHSLEQAGKEIAATTTRVRQNLLRVLTHAHRLRREQDTTPNVQAIAEATGLTIGEVRAALLYASVMGR